MAKFIYLLFISISLHSQTYNAPKLTCVQNIGNRNELTWRVPVVNCGAFIKYYIHHSNTKNGPYTIIDSINVQTTTFYSHSGINSSINNYYYLTSKYNCNGSTSLTSDTIVDSTMPTPELYSISIENGYPTYRWNPIIERSDLWAYIPFVLGNKIIDSVLGKNTRTYIDSSFDVSKGTYQGGLAAMDSCGGINGRSSFGFQQRTVFLTILNDPCSGEATLNWTKYVGWSKNDTVKEYQLLIKKNSEPETTITTLEPSIRSYIYTDLKYGDTVCIRIKALHLTDASIYSFSNQICLISTNVQKPKSLQVINATYIENNWVKITWYCDPNSKAKRFLFNVRNTKTGIDIRNFAATNPIYLGNGFYQFIDSFAFTGGQSTYTVLFEDSCNTALEGKEGRTLFLHAVQTGLYTNQLSWKKELFPLSELYTVSSYDLYMSYENGPLEKLATLDGTISTYQHLVEKYAETEGVFCYKIVAHYSFDTTPHLLAQPMEINSETSCLPMRSVIFIPNAFKVNGVTPMFKPKFVFWRGDYFNMKIFNRWGIQIFETNNAETGWDGTSNNGQDAKEDTYTYIISYKGNDGKTVNRTGNVTLIK